MLKRRSVDEIYDDAMKKLNSFYNYKPSKRETRLKKKREKERKKIDGNY